ncbi:uncharacterized protein (DUF1800 family) [Methylopila capsulata]|uniref:Uncharacterized protein (DUF1800 family) n=1 Tax=Methylopila capsulata TaxID=61654 RepID=A0A9W6IYL7_9HYPH|nr:DUF1800 family protein [Methylopila capsulata]MBM7853093.1 uncharacterized protein (DUF1800 family) [Methylopila capsulata]GLK57695.1 hypothetical protein GCM10008170_37150 [Methylopila capsulata]
MEPTHPSLLAVGRFGLGASKDGPPSDPRAYVDRQLDVSLPSYQGELRDTPGQLRTMVERRQYQREKINEKVAANREAKRKGEASAGGGDMADGEMAAAANEMAPGGGMAGDDDMAMDDGMARRKKRDKRRGEFDIDMTGVAKANNRAEDFHAWLESVRDSPCPYQERLALYWGNHFTVAAVKGKVAITVGPFQREVVRPNVVGSFHDMLVASTTHPSMIFYLDNERSIGPKSKVGQRGKRGINENLAREVLELHTLGADGGYTQADVTSFANVLSGWTVDLNPESDACGTTVFKEAWHEPGAKTVLGKRYADDGEGQLRAILKDLAEHPSTARHVSRRFARAFVADEASPALLAALERSFEDTGGDLKALARTLARHDEAWTAQPAKLRPPIEFVASVARLLGATPRPPVPYVALVAMGQPYLTAPSPKGWSDDDDAWATSDGIKTRLDWAQDLSARHADRLNMKQLVDTQLAGLLSDETRTAVLRGESQEQALTLLLLSPDFQRR